MLTKETISAAFNEIEAAGWPDGNGPWITHMDLALRKLPLDHQFLVVGYALGNTYDNAKSAAWAVLLEHVNKRYRTAPQDSDPGFGRTIRPASVLPGYPRKRR